MSATSRWLDGRRARAVRAWLGVDALGDGHGHAISADSQRRLRVEPSHTHSVVWPCAVLEDLDPLGRVTRARLMPSVFSAVPDPNVRRRWVASLDTPIDSGRCEAIQRRFDGSIDDARRLGAASVLVLDARDDGVLLMRFDETRQEAGSTWHASRSDAERQIEDEYGARDLPWREAPLDGGAISFFAYA